LIHLVVSLKRRQPMDLGLDGKTILITGASKGIGSAIVTGFATEGRCTIHAVARSEADLVALQEQHSESGSVIELHPLDLSSSKNRQRLVNEVPDIDVLVNNAGSIPRGSVDLLTEDEWRSAWDLKFWG
jgi:short-subunit dehydrogenase